MTASKYPKEFEVAIGGCFGPSFVVRLMDGKLMYEKSPGLYTLAPAIEIQPTPEQWDRFWTEVERIGVWNWVPYYEQRSTHGEDGDHWFVHLSLGDRSMLSEGDNCYPGQMDQSGSSQPFKQFLEALRELLGGAEIW
ncbi:MAG: hypothetical protein ACYC56_01095 [Candidatus Aquicultor sp.]